MFAPLILIKVPFKVRSFNVQALVAFITTVNGASLSSSEIENLLQRSLPPYMLPQIVIVDRIPLLTNGKTDRQALLKQYESSNRNDGEPLRHFKQSSGKSMIVAITSLKYPINYRINILDSRTRLTYTTMTTALSRESLVTVLPTTS